MTGVGEFERVRADPVAVTPSVSPAAWYGDPVRRWRWRYWDGTFWTPWVSDGRRVEHEELPAPEVDERVVLPFRAIWWGIGGIAVGEALGFLLAWAADPLFDDRYVFELIFGQAGLWTGFAAAVVIASKRYGTGHIWKDFGVRAKRGDIWLGLGFSFAVRIAGILVVLPIVLGFRHYFEHAPGSDIFDGTKHDRGALITLALIAALGAPFIEELLFRGLIMGSLRRFGATWAIGVQGVLFASGHMQVSYGRANIVTFVAILVAGLFLGWCAHHYKRLGVGMWTHGFFNLLVVVILLATSF